MKIAEKPSIIVPKKKFQKSEMALTYLKTVIIQLFFQSTLVWDLLRDVQTAVTQRHLALLKQPSVTDGFNEIPRLSKSRFNNISSFFNNLFPAA